jgi:hypothetical protein
MDPFAPKCQPMPDCMMSDDAEPCTGFRVEAIARGRERQENDALRAEIEWLRAIVNRVIEDLELTVFCDGHTRARPCEPECHCVQHYDAVRALIR